MIINKDRKKPCLNGRLERRSEGLRIIVMTKTFQVNSS